MRVNPTKREIKDRMREVELAAKTTDTIINKNFIGGHKSMQYKGVDVGTSTLIVAENDGQNGVTVKKERDAFFSMPADDMTINILENAGASYILDQDAGEIYIVGEDALTFANLFNKEARRPMKDGVLSNIDEKAMPMLKALLKGLIGQAPEGGTILKYSVPAAPVNDTFDIVYHQNILDRIFRELGYDPSPINEAVCVAYSELGDQRFTGISASFGGGLVNVAITNLGIPVDTFSFRGSGDDIDKKVAQAKAGFGWTATKVTRKKEKGISILEPKDDIEEAISIYYKHLLKYVAEQLAETLNKHQLTNFPDDVVFAVAGGTSLVGGFIDVFKEILEQAKLPIGIKEVRHAKEPLYAVAYGAHMAAGMEARKKEKQS